MSKMKKLLIAAIALALTGCAKVSDTEYQQPQTKPNIRSTEGVFVDQPVLVFTDPDTKCQYLVYSAGAEGGITSRLNSSGIPICPDASH